jgi:hypothetical protein
MIEVTAVPSSRSSRQRSVRFPERFQGPPGMANGGMVAGTLAAAIGAPAEITLRRPAPLDRALRLARSEAGTELWDGELLIASATPADPEVALPAPVSFIEACVATMRTTEPSRHPFPHCFVCGPSRSGSDAMRLLAGPTRKEGVVAAPWIPDPSLCSEIAGKTVTEVPAQLVWAALDCPGAWGIMSAPHIGPRPMVLGRIAGRVLVAPRVGARHVVIGFRTGEERRKHFCGTAIFDEHGQVCAYARSTWIAL